MGVNTSVIWLLGPISPESHMKSHEIQCEKQGMRRIKHHSDYNLLLLLLAIKGN